MTLRRRKAATPGQPLWEFHDAGAGGPKRVVHAPTLQAAVTKLAFELDALSVVPLDEVRGWKFREAKIAPGLRADVVYQAWTPPGETEPEREPPPAASRLTAPDVGESRYGKNGISPPPEASTLVPQSRDSGILDRARPETLRGQFGDASTVVLPAQKCECGVDGCSEEWITARRHPEQGWIWHCQRHSLMDWEEIQAEQTEAEFALA